MYARAHTHTPTLFADMHTGGGILSDKIGRRKSIFVCNVLMGIGSLSVLAWSYGVYVLMRFISGLGCGSGIVVNFVLMMEFTGVSHRGWMGGLGMNGLWAWGGVVIGLTNTDATSPAEMMPSTDNLDTLTSIL